MSLDPDTYQAGLAAYIATKALEQTVRSIVIDVYKGAKEAAKSAKAYLTEPGAIEKLVDQLASVRLVKTIWQYDKEVDLHDFYHPTCVLVNKTRKQVQSLDDMSKTECIVFEGIVGQGKSIFLRHLACQELLQGKRIPLFIEFRRLQGAKPLMKAIVSKLGDLGFEESEDLFKRLSTKGRAILMLDAFDELEAECVKDVISELESIHQRFPKLQIIITSRPDSPACRLSMFRVFRLATVAKDEIETLIARLVPDPEFLQNIKSALERSPVIHGVLVTPLMVTLLVLSFRAHGSLPETLAGFYEELVPVLLSRHDESKPGYVRPKACKLSDHRIRQVFEAFCFVSKRRVGTKPALSNRDVHLCAASAIKISRNECDEAAFVKDIVKVTCLLLEDGGEYSFLHKSVQEFGAAAFIRGLTDSSSAEFYSQLLGGKWLDWLVEISFLNDIDNYRFNKHFVVRDLEMFIVRVFQVPPANIKSISDDCVARFLSSFSVVQHRQDPSPAGSNGHFYSLDKVLEWSLYTRWVGTADMHALFSTIPAEVLEGQLMSEPGSKTQSRRHSFNLSRLFELGVMPRTAISAARRILKQLVEEWKSVSNSIKQREEADSSAVKL